MREALSPRDGQARKHLTSADLLDMAGYHDRLATCHAHYGREGLAGLNQAAAVNARAAIPAIREAEAIEAEGSVQMELVM